MIAHLLLVALLGFQAETTQPSSDSPTQEKQQPSETGPAEGAEAEKEKPRLKRPSLRRKPRLKKEAPDDSKPDALKAPETEDRGIPSLEMREPENDLDKELLEGLGQELEQLPEEGEEENPLMRAGRRMRESEEMLAQLDATEKTITVQKQIIEDLEELLRQAQNNNNNNQQQQQQQKQPNQKQQQQQQEQAQKQQQQEGNESQNRAGPPRPSMARTQQPKDPRQTKDVWGHLSEMLREEMSQYAKEGFLPKYRQALEQYYSDIASRSRSSE